MSFRGLVFIGLTIPIFLLMGSSAIFSGRTAILSPESNFDMPPQLLGNLQDGDVILRKGNTLLSELIALNFPEAEGMSHCGFIFKIDNHYQVIHTISKSLSDIDGIRMSPLEDFIRDAKQHRICIIRYYKELNSAAMKEKCLILLKQQIPFDDDFDLNDSSRMYCSELLRQIYLDEGEKDFFQKRKIAGVSVIDLSTFFNPKLFTPVYKNY